MILASHQPDFMPWMGYFYKVFKSDVFVFSDNVLYSKTGRHDYNDILTGNGVQRLKMPIHYELKNLNELKIAATDRDIEKMKKTIREAYGKAACFDKAYPVIDAMLMEAPGEVLAEFNRKCILVFCDLFGLSTGREFHRSSELPLEHRRDARIIEMCRLFGADTYISGEGAKEYHVEEDYRRNGIALVYSDYQPIQYPQVKGRHAINLSVIDYVMNCGFELPKEWKR